MSMRKSNYKEYSKFRSEKEQKEFDELQKDVQKEKELTVRERMADKPAKKEEPKKEVSKENKPSIGPRIAKVKAANGLRVRKSPSTDADILLVIRDGTQVTIKEYDPKKFGDWVVVNTPAGIEGYVMSKFLLI